jgi:hypothetical protein
MVKIFKFFYLNYFIFSLDKILDNQLTLSQIEVEPNTTVSMGVLIIKKQNLIFLFQ